METKTLTIITFQVSADVYHFSYTDVEAFIVKENRYKIPLVDNNIMRMVLKTKTGKEVDSIHEDAHLYVNNTLNQIHLAKANGINVTPDDGYAAYAICEPSQQKVVASEMLAKAKSWFDQVYTTTMNIWHRMQEN